MNSVNRTLYIPLYGKAYVSRRGIILRDRKAEEIWMHIEKMIDIIIYPDFIRKKIPNLDGTPKHFVNRA